MKIAVTLLLATMAGASYAADGSVVPKLLEQYRSEGAGPFDAGAGQRMWAREHQSGRSCSICHGTDLTKPGRHTRTKKTIEPLAPSANPTRLTSETKVKKWLYRNCKWTLGRECTAQEKGDFLVFIEKQ